MLIKRWAIVAAAAILAMVFIAFAWRYYQRVVERKAFTIVWSYDTSGQIEPCGCSSNMLGGLSRRATLIEQLSAQGAVLSIEGGHLLAAENSFQLFKGVIIVKALNEAGYDAMLLGLGEARLGVSGIEQLAEVAEFPLISANLVLDERPWPAPAVVMTVAGNHALITGVSQPELADANLPAGTGFSPAAEALDEVLDSYTDGATIIIVCLEGNSDWVAEMADKYADRADLFLTGDRSLDAHELARAAAAESGELSGDWELPNLAFHTSPPRLNTWGLGRYLGVIRIKPAYQGWAVAGENRSIARQLVPDESIETIINHDYKPHLVEYFADFAAELVQDYIPPEKCGGCHADEYQIYQVTAHSRSAESLAAQGRLYDPDCISCHVVYDPETDQLHSINCIWCHTNIKWNHEWQAMEGLVSAPAKPVAKYLPEYCLICHDPLNSLPFERHWPQYMQVIYHGGDLSQAQRRAAELGLDLDEPPPDAAELSTARRSR